MSVHAAILEGPLAPAGGAPVVVEGAGAWLVFEGIVRGLEEGRALSALDYQAYEPMASRQLAALAEDVAGRYGLLRIEVLHSRGAVPVGACSFRLSVWSAHRKEALAAMDEFIDRLKRDVPIWKRPVWAEGAEERR